MEEIKIIKESLTKDEYKFSVEVTDDNAKNEPHVTIKVRGDADVKEIVQVAIDNYKKAKKESRA